MLNKESAIAVIVAVMLGGASLFGGFSMTPALATLGPDAVQIASKTISQDDDESVIIDAVALTAEKSTIRASGTVGLEIIQDEDVLASATLRTSSLGTSPATVEVQVSNTEVTGSFEILVEYLGSGTVRVSGIEVLDGTEIAEQEPPVIDDGADSDPQVPQQELENVVANKAFSQDEQSLAIDSVEFSAEKSTTRARGTLTVAIVQGENMLAVDQISTAAISTFANEMEVSFDNLEVENDFRVVFTYEGSGTVRITNINVPGGTLPAEEPVPEPDPEPEPNPVGTVQLLVNAVDQDNQPLTGLWVALLQGLTLVDSGETEAAFTLNSNEDYIVEMGDYYDEASETLYDFNGWLDSTAGSRTGANDLVTNEEFTAKYIVTTGAPPPAPPADPPTTPPPSSAPGTITVYAYRIPHEKWGPTFVSADAQMYFVLYNSVGEIVFTDFYDENGNTITGLNDGETYWVMPQDCHDCHGGTHDVVFNHWENGSTERARAATTGMSVGAYYEYVPDADTL